MLSRRHMLAGGLGLVMSGPLGRIALAAAPAATQARFVLVILRGAMDGLAVVPPYFDPDYRRLRPSLSLPEPGQAGGALALGGKFGLHPALAPIHPWFAAGTLGIVHALASPYRGRSHFDAQDMLEHGYARPRTASDGWLNRVLAAMPQGGGGRRLGLAVGQTPPLVLRGPVPTGGWAPTALPEIEGDLLERIADLYAGDALLGPALASGMADQRFADTVLGDDMAMKGGGGRGNAAQLAEAAGRLLAAPDGARIATLELGGWDTHAGQGAADGRLAQALGQLAAGLVALKDGLGPAWAQTVVLAATEFGRTAAENGTGGTDHGTAGCCLLAGGAVRGGQVLGTWPGLAPDRLFEGRDLAPTTDLRAVAKGILRDHLRLSADPLDRLIFPDSAGLAPFGGLIRS